jgi:hypothetical protein
LFLYSNGGKINQKKRWLFILHKEPPRSSVAALQSLPLLCKFQEFMGFAASLNFTIRRSLPLD